MFFFEIGTSVVIYVKRNQFYGTLDDRFETMLSNHTNHERAWDNIQTEVNRMKIIKYKHKSNN